jgi:hypothetical protein
VRREQGGARRTAIVIIGAFDQVVFFVGLVGGVAGTTRGGGPTGGGFSGGVAAGGNTVPGGGATGGPGVGTTTAPAGAGAPNAGPSVKTGPSEIGAPLTGPPAKLGAGSPRNRLNNGRDVEQPPAIASNAPVTAAVRQDRNIASPSSLPRFRSCTNIPQKPAGRKPT